LLTELQLGDFEGWEGKRAVRLAPLTLFFGPNGSGKSTLIRAVCDKAAGRKPAPVLYRLRRGDHELEEALDRWLTLMGFASDFSVLDSGSGAPRALLVLVRAFASAIGTPVHLDHPESHLQPSSQSVLGDVLLAAVKTNGTQLLVETHSDRLLRRIQRRIAEGHAARDEVAVHFIEARQGKTEIQELVIDEYGNITNWPQGFFGDEMDNLAAMTNAAAERRSR
jgi:predicted ATPase